MTAAGLRTVYGAATAAVLAFILFPLVIVVWVSFFSNRILTFPPQGYTLAWYARAWSLDDFRNGFVTSLAVASCAMVSSLVLGIPASLAMVRHRFVGRDIIQTVLLSPMIVPGIVGGSALFIAFIQFEDFSDIQIAGTTGGLLIAHALIALPWTIRLVTASLIGMDRSVEDAAASLGATPATILRRITFPGIRHGIIAAALFSFVISFIDLEKSIFLIGPGRTTLQIALVNYLEWNLDSTVAAVAAVQIAIIGLALLVSSRYAKLDGAF